MKRNFLQQSARPRISLPPLSALEAFDRAAAHLSFLRAAKELGITPSAVSHRIRSLEQKCGVRLFARAGRAVKLTQAGEKYLKNVRAALEALGQASRNLQSQDGGIPDIRISALPFFTSAVLLPALGDFCKRFPHARLHIEATNDYADFDRAGVDAAIRYGRERPAGLRFDPLTEISIVPVCTPEIARAAFSAYENSKTPIVILLDEPGLGLHARAQADFLRFIDERLAKKCQVIYSTHSPFMVQPGKLERVRLVEDAGREVGSRITDNVLSADRDTLFPLQGALGYDMVQHLFIAPYNLVVEGTSDFVYLSLLSESFREKSKTALDPKLSIVPVGGVDLIPSFVALLGRHLNVSVLVDSRKEGHQRLQQLTQQGILKETGLVTIGEIIGRKAGDIEDLSEPSEYLELFNAAFGRSYTVADLAGSDPIVKRLARLMGVDRFDHGRPATILLRTQADFMPKLSDETLNRFEQLFTKINATIN